MRISVFRSMMLCHFFFFFTKNESWREAHCPHLQDSPRGVLVSCNNGEKLLWSWRQWASPKRRLIHSELVALSAPCRHLWPAAAVCSNVCIFQAAFSHTHRRTKIKISVNTFLWYIIHNGWVTPPFICHLSFSNLVLVIVTMLRKSVHYKHGFPSHVYRACVMISNVVTTQTTMSLNWRQHINSIQGESILKITARRYGSSKHQIFSDE